MLRNVEELSGCGGVARRPGGEHSGLLRSAVCEGLAVRGTGEVLAYDRESHGFHAGLKEADLMVRRFRELSKQKRAISVY